jgi:hypothetical protein
MILSLGRFGITPAEQTRALEESVSSTPEVERLDIYRVVSSVGAPAFTRMQRPLDQRRGELLHNFGLSARMLFAQKLRGPALESNIRQFSTATPIDFSVV